MDYKLLSDSTLRNFQAMNNNPAMKAKFGYGTTQAQNLGIDYTGTATSTSGSSSSLGISSPEMMALQAIGGGVSAFGDNIHNISQAMSGESDEQYATRMAKDKYGAAKLDTAGNFAKTYGSLLSLDSAGVMSGLTNMFDTYSDKKQMISESSSLSDTEKKLLKRDNFWDSTGGVIGGGLVGIGIREGYDWISGRGKRKDAAEEKLKNEQAFAYNKNLINQSDAAIGLNRNAFNIKSLGGKLSNNLKLNNLNPDIALIKVDNGGTHEVNTNGGIPMGINNVNGKPNLVEEGETVVNDYVLSNKIKLPKELFNGKFKDNTIADVSKKLYKEVEERPNDPISKKTWESNIGKLIAANEIMNINNTTNQMRCGGKLKE